MFEKMGNQAQVGKEVVGKDVKSKVKLEVQEIGKKVEMDCQQGSTIVSNPKVKRPARSFIKNNDFSKGKKSESQNGVAQDKLTGLNDSVKNRKFGMI